MEILISDEQLAMLINDVLETYGYDFNDYTQASLKRRVNRLFINDRFPSFAELRYRLRNDETYFTHFIEEITVNVTEMFRDPVFFKSLREQVLPILATYPFIRVWHAGCSTGEEVYSTAIILKESNLLHKSLLYATDLNPEVVKKAASGIFPIAHMKQYSENYHATGGREEFSTYYTAGYDRVIFQDELKKRMVFSTHNLVSESTFNQFQLIMCRNVLIYFEKTLQGKVFALFHDSLENLGFLALGSKETLSMPGLLSRYEQLGKQKIWRKIQ